MMMTLLMVMLATGFAQKAPDVTSPLTPLDEVVLIDGLPPGPQPSAEEALAVAKKLGAEMRCPVCQGMSVKDSTSAAAVNMYRRIHDLARAGYTETQIKDYFVDRYDEWVLLEPTQEGFNLLVWVGPGLFLMLGLGLVYTTVSRWEKEDDELPSDTGEQPKDRYEERLLAELEDE
ncbi:MAG: cytochrome c-type biogenesis protein CcmH [Myxococcota bacterium]